MDEEETIWQLDATSLSGFAIHSSSSSSPQYETPVHHTIETVDIQLSQTLESHSFPYHLQLVLSPRSKDPSLSSDATQSGIVVLLPLYNILNLVISDHASYGQSLRFKLVEPGRRVAMATRQVFSDAGPGRMYGSNEDDPYHLLGLLKFREFVVRNAGVDGRWGEIVTGWAACLQRNAVNEFSHHMQILREDTVGRWRIIEDEDDGCGMDIVKHEGSIEDVVNVDEDDYKDLEVGLETLRTPSIEVSDGTEDGEVHDEREVDLDRPTTTAADPTDLNQYSTPPSRHTDRSHRSEHELSTARVLEYENDQSPNRPEDDPCDDVRPTAAESTETSPEEDHFSRESPCRQQVRYRRNQRSALSPRDNRCRGFPTGANSIECTPLDRVPPSRIPHSPSAGPFNSPPSGRRNSRTVSPIASRLSENRPQNREMPRQFDSPRREPRPRQSRYSNNHTRVTGRGYDSYRPQRRSSGQDEASAGREERTERRGVRLEIERRE
jgi:hypothetical protein